MGWKLKSSWYRPPSLTWTRRPQSELEADYFAWLAKSRGWSEDKAEEHARSQPHGELGHVEGAESNLRAETYVAANCIIRTHSAAGSRVHWNGPAPEDCKGVWYTEERVPKGEFATTYTVMLNGRYANAFLTKSRAKEWAIAELKRRAEVERHFQSQVLEAIELMEAA